MSENDTRRLYLDSNCDNKLTYANIYRRDYAEYRITDQRDDIKGSGSMCLSNDTDKLIFRYKFSKTFMDNLYEFSKIHEHDDRSTYKENWEIWLQENNELVKNEINILQNTGYEGNILNKMFKSSRYYFRKKKTEKKEPKHRRIYVGVSQELLDCMDKYIEKFITIKPATSFIDFCKENAILLQEEVNLLYKKGYKDSHEILMKVKKTYKNRYFIKINTI
jgi:hypothetical protein